MRLKPAWPRSSDIGVVASGSCTSSLAADSKPRRRHSPPMTPALFAGAVIRERLRPGNALTDFTLRRLALRTPHSLSALPPCRCRMCT
jgi:hypothetical protein